MGQHEAQKSKDHLIRNIEFHHEHCGGTKAALVYDVAVCSAGGILIGSWQKHHGVFPETLEAVTEKVKTEGGYPYDKLPILLVAALLPLIFGGAIGPEAGITGQRPSGHGTLQAAAGNRQRQHGLEEGDHLPNDLFHGCHRLCLRHLDQRHRLCLRHLDQRHRQHRHHRSHVCRRRCHGFYAGLTPLAKNSSSFAGVM